MRGIKRLQPILPLLLLIASVAGGAGLFFFLRSLEILIRGSPGINTLLEESVKLGSFLIMGLARRIHKGRHGGMMLTPFFCIIGFGVLENIAYFLRYPTSSIYERLIYSYPIHLNTGLLYSLAFQAGKPLPIALAYLFALAYHFGLNTLSLILPRPALYGIGIGNLILFFALYWQLRVRSLERSLRHAGI